MKELEELLALVTKEEDRFYDLAHKAMEENNMFANQVCIAQASAFQKVRYTIENMLSKD